VKLAQVEKFLLFNYIDCVTKTSTRRRDVHSIQACLYETQYSEPWELVATYYLATTYWKHLMKMKTKGNLLYIHRSNTCLSFMYHNLIHKTPLYIKTRTFVMDIYQ